MFPILYGFEYSASRPVQITYIQYRPQNLPYGGEEREFSAPGENGTYTVKKKKKKEELASKDVF